MRILIVEDEPEVADLVRETLEDEGYAVDVAEDGEVALELTRSFPYDLVVLDVMLPERDGFDVTRTLRSERRAVPILMLTARDAVADRVAGLGTGADDYLVKPFHLDELRARVLALLRRAGGQPGNEMVVGRARIDLMAKRAWFGGREIRLAAREYAVLEYLALHAEGYHAREELLEHIWPGTTAIDPRTVDTYIHHLRQKLADDCIDTVRGIGYRLVG